MAERIVSAGVFTNEVDQSFLPAAIGAIGAVVVGPTIKGPALVPTTISSYSEFQQIFGSYTDESYVPFTAEEYLRNGDTLTVVRLLYEDGYALSNGSLAIMAESASVKYVTHVLHPTVGLKHISNATDVLQTSVVTTSTSGSFNLILSGSYTANTDVSGVTSYANGTAYSASINSSATNYITKIFGKSPKSIDYPVYVQYEHPSATSLFNNLGAVTMSLGIISNYSITTDYAAAETPYVTSQKIGTAVRNLFKFATLSHGTAVNSDVKVGIRDIKLASEVSDPNGYGQFTVEVRRINTSNIPNSPYSSQDTDSTPDIVETYLNVNLDPDSSNYIVRRIGDRYISVSDNGDIVINGDYPNVSKYIRVVAADGVKNKTNEKTLVPFGFRAPASPIPMASGSVNLAPITYNTTQVSGTYNSNTYLGFDFTNRNNLNYLAPLPNVGQVTGSNSDFYLGDVSQDADAAYPTLTAAYSGSIQNSLTSTSTYAAANGALSDVAVATRKFMLPIQGGFDGSRPNLPKFSGAKITSANTFGFDCTNSSSPGTKSYNKAFSILSNADFYDFNMLITPGIIDSKHSVVTGLARNLCTSRQDAFYVMDPAIVNESITDVVNQVTTLDNNYTATYWPWVRILNREKNVPVWVPPSVVVPGALTFNDRFAAPWYAPAGLNRGGLPTVLEAYTPLSQAQRNTLYEARVNPIATFPNDGVVVWGQKTLQGRPSALDRVNVRRLLITVKKFIASATRYLVFEQSNVATRNRFLNIVNPYLESVRAQQGLTIFKVVMDDTNNTPDLIDRNIMYGQIFLQPTRTAEFIILDFNIQPTGAAFPE